MSFQSFFHDDSSDTAGEQSSTAQEAYQTFAPHPARIQYPQTVGNILPTYPSRSTWAPPSVNPQNELSYIPNNSDSQYFTLSSAFNHGNLASSYPDPSQQAYIPSSSQHAKIEMPAQPTSYPQYQDSDPIRYHPGNVHGHQAPSFNTRVLSYPSASVSYHPQRDLILLDSDEFSHHESDTIKEEPCTPMSPQFIFEFPGADDDPPSFELPSAPVFCDPSSSSQSQSGLDAPARTRASSPTTEAMSTMMSVFRVDPFASYEADSGTRRKRRKRASTYARSTDPEANSKEPPLIFSFQLDVGQSDNWGFGLEGEEDGEIDDFDALYALPSSNLEPKNDNYDVLDGDAGGYRLQPVSMPAPIESSTGGGDLYEQNRSDAVDFLLTRAFQPVNPSDSQASTSSLSASAYPLSNSRHSSPGISPPPTQSEILQLACYADGLAQLHGRTSSPTFESRRELPRPPMKMHTCWICHKEFPRPSSLATHMNTHSGAKPYKCPVPECAKTFAVRSNARRHLRTHAAPSDSVPRESQAPDIYSSESGNEAHDCTVLGGTSVSPAADSPSSAVSPMSPPPYLSRGHPRANDTSRPSFDETNEPFSFGVSIPIVPAIPSAEDDVKCEERGCRVNDDLPFSYNPMQFRDLSGPKASYTVSLSVNPLLALGAR